MRKLNKNSQLDLRYSDKVLKYCKKRRSFVGSLSGYAGHWAIGSAIRFLDIQEKNESNRKWNKEVDLAWHLAYKYMFEDCPL